MSHFAEVVNGAAEPLISYRDGISALAIAEAAMHSHRAARVAPVEQ
jgi:predicted dehydrogenase